jgi:N-acetylmuramoyl-L-alanine amidase
MIDPGHGGKDPGAVGNGLKEKDLTLDIAQRIRRILETEYTGVQVRLTRETDTYLDLSERAKLANDWGADFFLSIHINAGGGTGWESFRYTSASSRSVAYQNVIHPEVIRATGVTDRGKKAANFAVVRETKMPALLTENLFIDTSRDAALLKDSTFLEKLARGHVVGLEKSFGLKRKSNIEESPKEEPDMLKAAVVINSFADFPVAEAVAARYKAPIYLKNTVEGEIAETVYVVGGSAEEIKAKKVINLSGSNRFETAQKVGKHLGQL